MASKQTLREVYLEKRFQLSESELKARNQRLRDNLFASLKFEKVKFIHLFLSIKSKKEVDTFRIMEEIKYRNPEVKFVVPKTKPNGILDHFILNENCVLKENNWGITEPIEGDQLEPELIDMVLVPLIIFDKEGHRIGYGKGYYDRFLITTKAQKVGLSLLPPTEKIQFIDDTDVKLDCCITPDQVYTFPKS